jgi:HlyD family secretion protein
MELVVSIDELDIPGVTLGQRAVISVDALPNVSLEGKVSYISPMPTTAAGVVGYEAKVSFTPPKGLGLRAGMSASADIITAQSKNVLLIPDRAIKRDSQGKATVEVTLNGQIEVRAIVTGVSDGSQTEIIKGLSEGEQVVEKQTAAKPSGSSLLFGG